MVYHCPATAQQNVVPVKAAIEMSVLTANALMNSPGAGNTRHVAPEVISNKDMHNPGDDGGNVTE